jgi:hypothetical protein
LDQRALSLLPLPDMPDSPTMGRSKSKPSLGTLAEPLSAPDSPTLGLSARKAKSRTPSTPPPPSSALPIATHDPPRTPPRRTGTPSAGTRLPSPSPSDPHPLALAPLPERPHTPPPPPLVAAAATRTPPPSTPHKDRDRERDIMRYLNLSPERTPLSHRGVHMSPSPSLAHYKSHLGPPPPPFFFLPGPAPSPASSSRAPLLDLGSVPSSQETEPDAEPDVLRTPSRHRRASAGAGAGAPMLAPHAPVTPKKQLGVSMYGIFNPHDPALALDEELRLGGPAHARFLESQSPAGLFGGTRGMLYESPSGPSPGPWSRRY